MNPRKSAKITDESLLAAFKDGIGAPSEETDLRLYAVFLFRDEAGHLTVTGLESVAFSKMGALLEKVSDHLYTYGDRHGEVTIRSGKFTPPRIHSVAEVNLRALVMSPTTLGSNRIHRDLEGLPCQSPARMST